MKMIPRSHLPRSSNGKIILITLTNYRAIIINLKEMKMDTATVTKLLLRIKDSENNDPDTNHIEHEIVDELGHLPLAIDLAGAIMEFDRLTPALFLERYKT